MEFSIVSATKYDHIVSLFLYMGVMISFLSEFRKSRASTKKLCATKLCKLTNINHFVGL